MGEQSRQAPARQARWTTSSSRARRAAAAAGIAEVSLTFDSSGLTGPSRRAEYPGARRHSRDRRDASSRIATAAASTCSTTCPSRLTDVVEFFLGTGVGTKAYSIIEQGRIGFIVSSQPEDRRGPHRRGGRHHALQVEEEGGREEDGLDARSTCCACPTFSRRSRSRWVAAAAGAEGGALQAVHGELQGPRSVVVGAALPRTPRGGKSRAPSWQACARVIRPRAPRWRRERPPPTPTACRAEGRRSWRRRKMSCSRCRTRRSAA